MPEARDAAAQVLAAADAARRRAAGGAAATGATARRRVAGDALRPGDRGAYAAEHASHPRGRRLGASTRPLSGLTRALSEGCVGYLG